MSVKIIAYLHPAKNERTILEVASGSIKDIINCLNTGFPITQARVCRNGEIIKDFTLTANDGDTLWIKFVPYGDNQTAGAGMKIGGWALTIAGLIVGVVTSWTGIGAFFGSMMMGAGIGMITGGQVLLNVNIPKLEDMEKPENDPSIRGGKNQARPHGRIPVLFGRHRIYPDLAANPHTSIIGNQQYLTQLFCGGYKDCEIDLDSFKLGETKLVDLSSTKNIQQILAGLDSVIRMEILQNGEPSNLYPHCIHEEVFNVPLQHEIDNGDGEKISGGFIRTTPDNTDTINIDIFLYNGIGKYNDEGKLNSASVEIKASYKNVNDSTYQLLGYFNNGSNTISGAELKTKRYQITKEGLIPGKYDVKIERTTADSTDSKVVDTVHLGSIRSIKQVRPIRADRQKDLTIIALRVTATARLNNVLDTFNYVAVSKLPVYSNNGSGSLYWLNTAVTQNPASMLLYALRGKAAQQQVEPDNIDWQSFEAFYLWCEEHDYKCNAYISESVTIAELMRMIGNTARADILRIDSKISVVQDIERPGPVQLFTPKNTISYSITMFNADTPDQIALRYIDEDAGFIHNEVQVYNTPDGNRGDKPPNTIQKVDLWGITNNKQARRIGMYNYACIKNRPFFHTIDVDIEYLLCNKGDCVHYAGDIALTGSVQGRIKGIIWVDGVCVGIDTDEPVPMAEGHLYAVRIRLSNGTIILKEVVFNPGIRREKSFTYYPVDDGEDLYEPFIGDMYAVDEDNVIYEPFNVILFTEPLDANNVPKAGDIYAFGVRGYEVVELIITDIQPGQNFTATLSCVEHSPEIFDVDKPDFVLPDFINRITPVSGAIDDGVINPVNWQRFSLFHDSEDEPHRPSSDWQNEGWYQSQNFRSIWQSSKLAEIIESGEWSLPVRIKSYRGTDDITPIWLGLTPQNITLETDGDGNIQTGLFPITIQARLLQWNSLLSDVIYSLPDNKAGISIDSNGVITVNKNADLDDNNNIRVNAEYNGTVYTSVINIKKNIRNSPARYLGTVTELQLTSTVTIIKGPQPGQVRALQGDYVLAVAAVKNQSAGSVFQWTGLAWEYRSPATHSDLYMRSFKDGLDVPELTKDMGWFGAVFAKMLVVMDAFIETLSAQKILLKNGGIIQSDNYDPVNKIGWMIDYLGNAVFNNATVRGHIDAESGSIRNLNIDNVTIGKEAVYLGIIKTGPVFISNETTAPIEPRVFAANTRIRDIVEALGPNATINVSTGYFGTIQGLKTVIVSLRSTGVFSYTYTISLIFNNSVPYEISDTGNISPPPTLGAVLSLGGSIPGKIFIMENLPIGSEGLQAGSVYRNGNQLMIV